MTAWDDPRWRRRAGDATWTVVALGMAAADLAVNQPGTRDDDAWSWAIWAAQAVALLGRRRFPLAAGAVCVAGVVTWAAMGHIGELLNLPGMVALYVVAVSGSRRRTLVVGGAAVLLGGVGRWLGSADTSPVLDAVWPVVPLLLGEVVRQRREWEAEHRARVEAEADARVRTALGTAAEERLDAAREVHDVVAHTLAAVNVQMGVAATAFDTRPEVARQALTAARHASREAMAELRSTTEVLRSGAARAPGADPPAEGSFGAGGDRGASVDRPPGGAATDATRRPGRSGAGGGPGGRRGDRGGARPGTSPEAGPTVPSGRAPERLAAGPGLGDLDALVARARAAGLDVTWSGVPPMAVDAATGRAGYRIVQEALTNVLRHSGAGHVEVDLRAEGRGVALTVRDDGCGVTGGDATGGGVGGGGAATGLGLVGMAERAAGRGGWVEHGPGPDGGFVVQAWLPARGSEDGRV